jgi:hypothetical protein
MNIAVIGGTGLVVTSRATGVNSYTGEGLASRGRSSSRWPPTMSPPRWRPSPSARP